MKIEVEEYVRTNEGIIDQVIIDYNGKCNNSNCNGKHVSCKINYYNEGDIVKHSKNIIGLIEVGDYVNGYKVVGVTLDPAPSGKCVDIDCDKPSYESYLFEEQIYSIVTKEQFASMEYKVEEDR